MSYTHDEHRGKYVLSSLLLNFRLRNGEIISYRLYSNSGSNNGISGALPRRDIIYLFLVIAVASSGVVPRRDIIYLFVVIAKEKVNDKMIIVACTFL